VGWAMAGAVFVAVGGRFALGYLDADGTVAGGPLSADWNIRFGSAPTGRSFPLCRSRRNRAMCWWVTSGDHVGYESLPGCVRWQPVRHRPARIAACASATPWTVQWS
jgi:hypothetical protein